MMYLKKFIKLHKSKFQIYFSDLLNHSVEEIEKTINNNYTKLIPLLTREEAKNIIPLML